MEAVACRELGDCPTFLVPFFLTILLPLIIRSDSPFSLRALSSSLKSFWVSRSDHVIPAGVLKFSPSSLNLRSYSTGQTYEIIASGWYFSICYHGTDHSRLS